MWTTLERYLRRPSPKPDFPGTAVTAVLERPQESVACRQSTFGGESSNLDLIRAVAVLCVFFGHLPTYRADEGTHDIGWHFAQMGVLIFFVHTSFVLMLSLERSVAKNGLKYLFRDFYTRRFFRIYPLAIVCVLISYFTHGPSPEGYIDWSVRELISNLTLTMNLTYSQSMVGGLWTLPLEIQMYIVLPILFLFLRGRAVWYALVVWAATIGLAFLQPHISERLNIMAYAPCFLGGVLAWRLSLSVKRRINGWWWPPAFVATWTLFLIASREHHMLYRFAFCLGLGLAIPHFAEWKAGWLQQVAHQVAKYSYGIYLSHTAVMAFVGYIDEPYRWPVLAFLAITCPLAMYHFVEAPFIRLGQRVARTYRSPGRNRALVQPAPVSVDNPEPGI
jgi:peptidoglycan/LPS O-acetylase OafA/YrhL